MPMSTFVGGFPMAAAGLNDKDGYVIGGGQKQNGSYVEHVAARKGSYQ